VAGVFVVLDDAVWLHQAPSRVDVLDGWKHGPSDLLGRLHHLLECLAVVDGAIPVPGCDATGQDALDGAAIGFKEDPGSMPNFFTVLPF
jgi:hypothetical protein